MSSCQRRVRLISIKIRSSEAVLVASGLVFVGCYLALTLHTASQKPLWMDEILSIWASRLPTVAQVCDALLRGSEFAPPGFPLFLHFYSMVAGGSNLALRLPSITAVLLSGIFAFALFRRHIGASPAAFAACLLLLTLSPFALQVRPYAIVTLCFVVSLFAWDQMNEQPSWLPAAWIAVLLGAATSFHFYAVLYVPCIGGIELLRLRRTRQLRLLLWGALTAAGASVFLWYPFMRADSRFAAEDVASSTSFGAFPRVSSLLSMYSYLFQGWGNIHLLGGLGLNGFIVLCAVVLIGVGGVLDRLRGKSIDTAEQASFDSASGKAEFWNLTIGSLLFPLLVFIFALAVTKTLNLRYVIGGAVGTSALLAETLGGFPHFRRLVPLILIVAAAAIGVWGVPEMELFDHRQIYGALPGSEPIVLADGMEFFPLMESAPPEFKSRLVYVLVPKSVPVPDASGEDAILRWKTIDPNLPVQDLAGFLKEHKKFYVLDERTSDETPAAYLSALHRIDVWREVHGALIFRSHPVSAADIW